MVFFYNRSIFEFRKKASSSDKYLQKLVSSFKIHFLISILFQGSIKLCNSVLFFVSFHLKQLYLVCKTSNGFNVHQQGSRRSLFGVGNCSYLNNLRGFREAFQSDYPQSRSKTNVTLLSNSFATKARCQFYSRCEEIYQKAKFGCQSLAVGSVQHYSLP